MKNVHHVTKKFQLLIHGMKGNVVKVMCGIFVFLVEKQ